MLRGIILRGFTMKRIAALVFLLLGLAMPAEAAYLVQAINIGNWSGGAYYDDGTRRFSHCAVGADYNNGVYLVLGWDEAGLNVGFVDERWNSLPIGGQTNVRIQIDNTWDSQGPANVVALGHLLTIMGREPRPVTAMRRGLQLTATIGKETITFDLTDTNAAIDALAACYRTHS